MKELNIKAEGSTVVVTFDRPLQVFVLDWKGADDLWKAMKAVTVSASNSVVQSAPFIESGRHTNVRWKDNSVAVVLDKRTDRLLLPWRVAVRLWKAIKTAARMAERWDKTLERMDDARVILDTWLPAKEKYNCPKDHARLAAQYGAMFEAIVGVPAVKMEKPNGPRTD